MPKPRGWQGSLRTHAPLGWKEEWLGRPAQALCGRSGQEGGREAGGEASRGRLRGRRRSNRRGGTPGTRGRLTWHPLQAAGSDGTVQLATSVRGATKSGGR